MRLCDVLEAERVVLEGLHCALGRLRWAYLGM